MRAWVCAIGLAIVAAFSIGEAAAQPQCVVQDIPGEPSRNAIASIALTPAGEITATRKVDGGGWSAWGVTPGAVAGDLHCYARAARFPAADSPNWLQSVFCNARAVDTTGAMRVR